MSQKKQDNNPSKQNQNFLFSRTQYYIMIAGLLVIALGFILMAGGGSDDPEVFNEAIYNTRRIRVAPTLVILGFAIEVFAILYRRKK
ncbi:MAG: hypothetical protein CR968_01345 [Flavobacteriia bacterium]|nr:MAG: hypothetical protein CR968_01345 [Flavobacteriia bacterium]